MIVVDLRLLEPPLEAGRIERRRVRRHVGAEQIHRHAEMEIQVALDRRQIDDAAAPNLGGVIDALSRHDFGGPLDHPGHARLADEHMVRLLRQHEARGARERIETRFGERAELELAIAVGEVGEHEVRQPVGRPLVERAEDPRIVRVARTPREKRFGFLAAVAPEIGVQQIHHRPQMTALFDVHLKEIPQVVERRRGEPEMTLLLDRRGLRVALCHDEPAQVCAMLPGHFLPRRVPLVCAEVDLAIGLGGIQEDAPAIVGHPDEIEMRPALGIDADRGTQVDLVIVRAFGPHLAPPVQERGLPLLERALEHAVLGEADVVRDLFTVVDVHESPQLERENGARPSDALPVEFRLVPRAEDLERALFTGGVGPVEDPVLPGGEAREDFGVQRFGAGEAEARLHAGQCIG